jgi:hypothetical protein
LWTDPVRIVKRVRARVKEMDLRPAVRLDETAAPGLSIPAPAGRTGNALAADRPSGTGLRRPRISPWVRVGLFTLGGALIAIGVAGLVLPFIQGFVTILAGLVVVSLGSHGAHRWTRRSLRRWPRLLAGYERMRRSLVRRRFRRAGRPAPGRVISRGGLFQPPAPRE